MSDRLCFYHPLRWYVYHPRDAWRELRWMWQRATRGYAECDVWNLGDYVLKVLPPALRELANQAHTYQPQPTHGYGLATHPVVDHNDPESVAMLHDWQERLRGIADCIGLGRDVGLLSYPKHSADMAEYTAWYRVRYRLWLRGMRELRRWMFDLWD